MKTTRAIMSVSKKGICPVKDHRPFTAFDKNWEGMDFRVGVQALAAALDGEVLPVEAQDIDVVLRNIGNVLNLQVGETPRSFGSIRQAVAYILGIDSAYDKSKKVDSGVVLKAMGMAAAQVIPLHLGHLGPGDKHPAFCYHPTSLPKPLSPQACMNECCDALKPQDALGVSSHLYKHLRGPPEAEELSLREVRQRLQTYVSTGTDHATSVWFEMLMVACVKKLRIAVMIVDDDHMNQNLNQMILIKPRLSLQPSEAVRDFLREAGGAYLEAAEKDVFHDMDSEHPLLEVIVLYRGHVYVCEEVDAAQLKCGEQLPDFDSVVDFVGGESCAQGLLDSMEGMDFSEEGGEGTLVGELKRGSEDLEMPDKKRPREEGNGTLEDDLETFTG